MLNCLLSACWFLVSVCRWPIRLQVYFTATCLHSHPEVTRFFLLLSRQEEDVDFLAKFSRLVNGMGQSLVLSWTKLAKTGNVKEAADTLQAVEAKVPLLLQLLVHEDDDISANIVGFCYEYLHVLKQVNQSQWT